MEKLARLGGGLVDLTHGASMIYLLLQMFGEVRCLFYPWGVFVMKVLVMVLVPFDLSLHRLLSYS